jgi:cell division protein ZapD
MTILYMNNRVQSSSLAIPCSNDKADTSKNSITYEFPINEHVRFFLRLEQLFTQFEQLLSGKAALDKASAINCLLDILSILQATSLRLEIAKELENQIALNRIYNASVEVENIQTVRDLLNAITTKTNVVEDIKNDIMLDADLLQSIARCRSIPGGAYGSYLPKYHYWLMQDDSTCLSDLKCWNNLFTVNRLAIHLMLKIISSRTDISHHIAVDGFFKMSFDQKKPPQLLKVSVDSALPYFASISASKHRCSIQFMRLSNKHNLPEQGIGNISFLLSC